MKRSKKAKPNPEPHAIAGVLFDQFGECEICRKPRYISMNGICGDCLIDLQDAREDPYLRAVRLKKIAQSETGIIRFARRFLQGRNSQRDVTIKSQLEKLAKRDENDEGKRIDRILGASPTLLADTRALTGVTPEVCAINDELIAQLRSKPSDFYQLSPRKFEEFIAALLERMGYEVQLTPGSHDRGRDVLAKIRLATGELLTVVQCKRYAPHRPIGIEIIERFLWTIEHTDHASCGLMVTTSSFTSGAVSKAAEFQYKLHLADFQTLQTWIGPLGVWERKPTSGIWIPPN